MAAAVHALQRLEAKSASSSVLETLERSGNLQVRRACLEFFSRVAGTSSIALSLLKVCNEMLEMHQGDIGVELLIASALARQLSVDDSDCTVGRRVIDLLCHAADPVRLALLDTIREDGEFTLVMFRPDCGLEMRKVLDELSRSENAGVAAGSWLVRVLGAYFVEETRDKEAIWPAIAAGTELALEIWFEKLEEHNVRYVFDEPADIEGLKSLVGRFNGRFDTSVYEVLCQLDSEQVVDLLAQGEFEPSGSYKVNVLQKLARADHWRDDYDALLNTALRDIPEFVKDTGAAWTLLAKLKAGQIETDELFRDFPGSLNDFHRDQRLGEKEIVEALELLKPQLNAKGKRGLKRLLEKIADIGRHGT